MNLNPLIGHSTVETVQHVAEALGALMVLLAPAHSDLCRLLTPLQSALDYEANKPSTHDDAPVPDTQTTG